MGVTIKLRGDTAANWLTANPVLAAREVGLELDTQLYKVGDGVSNWDSLTYWGQMPAHNHNDQYYTEEEIDGLLNGVSAEPDAGIWIWINQFEVANNPSANGSNVLVQCDAVQTWGDQPVGEIDLFGVRILQAGYYRIGCGALLYSPGTNFKVLSVWKNGIILAYCYNMGYGWQDNHIFIPRVWLDIDDDLYVQYRIDNNTNTIRFKTDFGGGLAITRLHQ
ncbi:MAG: hypothetical protein H6633_16720 [Anaerolineales bacterium]|nr:hypothetical protein [Anaerolineales bacterium]